MESFVPYASLDKNLGCILCGEKVEHIALDSSPIANLITACSIQSGTEHIK